MNDYEGSYAREPLEMNEVVGLLRTRCLRTGNSLSLFRPGTYYHLYSIMVEAHRFSMIRQAIEDGCTDDMESYIEQKRRCMIGLARKLDAAELYASKQWSVRIFFSRVIGREKKADDI